MGGRGARSASSGVVGALSKEAQASYALEMSDADNFSASFLLQSGVTKDAIGYQMYVHKEVTGRSLIADTRSEVDELKRALRTADADGRSYGMSAEAIKGLKQGLRDKISLREKAIDRMTDARTAYEKYSKEATIGNNKSKRRRGKWM